MIPTQDISTSDRELKAQFLILGRISNCNDNQKIQLLYFSKS